MNNNINFGIDLGTTNSLIAKFQLEESKRKLAQQLDAVGKEQQLVNLVEQYYEYRNYCEAIIKELNDPSWQLKLDKIMTAEKAYQE